MIEKKFSKPTNIVYPGRILLSRGFRRILYLITNGVISGNLKVNGNLQNPKGVFLKPFSIMNSAWNPVFLSSFCKRKRSDRDPPCQCENRAYGH